MNSDFYFIMIISLLSVNWLLTSLFISVTNYCCNSSIKHSNTFATFAHLNSENMQNDFTNESVEFWVTSLTARDKM